MTFNRFRIDVPFESGHTGVLKFSPGDWTTACQAVGAWYDLGLCSWDDMCDALDVVAAILRSWARGQRIRRTLEQSFAEIDWDAMEEKVRGTL